MSCGQGTFSAWGATACAMVLAACMSDPPESSPPVGVETQRGHARVVLADGRRCRAPFPPTPDQRATGTLEGCGQPWPYAMELAPRSGGQMLVDIVLGINAAVGSVFGGPAERRAVWILRIDGPDEQRWRWQVRQGPDDRGAQGEPLRP